MEPVSRVKLCWTFTLALCMSREIANSQPVLTVNSADANYTTTHMFINDVNNPKSAAIAPAWFYRIQLAP
jgi:hypothetical protein